MNELPETEQIWWPVPNGNGGGNGRTLRPSSVDLAEVGSDALTEEIWGRRNAARPVPSPAEPATTEDIWGPPARIAGRTTAASESIWDEREDVEELPSEPPPAFRRPLVLPAAWAARPVKPSWRQRLDSVGRLSRRTG